MMHSVYNILNIQPRCIRSWSAGYSYGVSQNVLIHAMYMHGCNLINGSSHYYS